ncbi:MAG: YciI family protein [Chthoniobacterales bacterium]
MRVMVIVKANKDSEAGVMPSPKLLAEMGKFNEELVKAGVMQAGEGLKPTAQGARVTFSGPKREVSQGPFPESKDLVAGFWLWQVKSKDEAIEWLKRAPFEDATVEIRPLYEAEDFAASDPTGEQRQNEARLRAETQKRGA